MTADGPNDMGPARSNGDAETVGAERFAHGALSHFLASPGAVDDRIDAALAQIDATRIDAPPVRPRVGQRVGPLAGSRSLAVFATAAALLLIGVLLWGLPEPPTLLASVRRIVAVAAAPVDRSYAFVFTDEQGRTTRGTLTSRGADAFVVELETRAGTMRLGYDGERSWLVPPRQRMPVRVGTGLARVRRALARGERVQMPFFTLATMLDQLPDNYDLVPAESRSDGTELAFRAARRAPADDVDWPASVFVSSDSDTAVVQRMRVEWDGPRRVADGRARQFELRLVGEQQRDGAFYSHTFHHRPGREVVQFQ